MVRRRQPARTILSHRFRILRTGALLFAGILIWILINASSLLQFISRYHERNMRLDRVEALREKVSRLELERESLERGLFENEKAARETYRLVLPGEKLILLRPADRRTSAPSSAPLQKKVLDTKGGFSK